MIEKDKVKELAEELRRFIGNMEDASSCGGGRSWRNASNKSRSWAKEYVRNILLRNGGRRLLPRKRTYLLDRCRNVRWISIRLRIYLLIIILEYGKTYIYELP